MQISAYRARYRNFILSCAATLLLPFVSGLPTSVARADSSGGPSAGAVAMAIYSYKTSTRPDEVPFLLSVLALGKTRTEAESIRKSMIDQARKTYWGVASFDVAKLISCDGRHWYAHAYGLTSRDERAYGLACGYASRQEAIDVAKQQAQQGVRDTITRWSVISAIATGSPQWDGSAEIMHGDSELVQK